jgi:hypothetical protein
MGRLTVPAAFDAPSRLETAVPHGWTRHSADDAPPSTKLFLVVASRLGVRVLGAYVGDGAEDGGACSYAEEAPPEIRATVALAPTVWLTEFQSSEFRSGPGGVVGSWGRGLDLETAIRAVGDDVGLQ